MMVGRASWPAFFFETIILAARKAGGPANGAGAPARPTDHAAGVSPSPGRFGSVSFPFTTRTPR